MRPRSFWARLPLQKATVRIFDAHNMHIVEQLRMMHVIWLWYALGLGARMCACTPALLHACTCTHMPACVCRHTPARLHACPYLCECACTHTLVKNRCARTTLEIEASKAGFSLARDLSLTPSLGVWAGSGSLSEAIERNSTLYRGAMLIGGKVTYLGGMRAGKRNVTLAVSGSVLLDVKDHTQGVLNEKTVSDAWAQLRCGV